MSALIDRRAFSDFLGLAILGAGTTPDIKGTLRRIFVAERRTDFGRPDHFYKGYLEHRLGDLGHIAELPATVLGRLAERFLERRDGRIVVRHSLFRDWHELLPFVSPLAIVVAFVVNEGDVPSVDQDPRPILARDIGHTSLVGPLDLPLDDLIEREGLNELHMHLNGTTELDVLWSEACLNPDSFYREIDDAYKRNEDASAELYEQIEPGLNAYGLFVRLRAARRVRRLVAEHLLEGIRGRQGGGAAVGRGAVAGAPELSAAMSFTAPDGAWRPLTGAALSEHPAHVIYPGEPWPLLVEEAAWLHACLSGLRRDPGDRLLGTGLYFNLLVQAQVARISVQQVDEKGFDQFQKYTLVGAREEVERLYESRFHQINDGGRAPVLAHLEGRFAPKSTSEETFELVGRIIDGYLAFRRCEARGADGSPTRIPPCLTDHGCKGCGSQNARHDAEFCLVAHFVKKRPSFEKDDAARCFDSDLRADLRIRLKELRKLLDANALVRALVRGVDAAANELHAPPEPFAPTFRAARRCGIHRATFHVGEDFRHLLSGVRAVAEALEFLDLRSGDRVGHATALGIDPSLWSARTADTVMLPRLDHLDDAVFAHHVLSERGGFERDLVKLQGIVATQSAIVYGAEVSPFLLHRAWGLRSIDMLIARRIEASIDDTTRRVDADAVAEAAIAQAGRTLIADEAHECAFLARTIRSSGAAYRILSLRHAIPGARRREKIPVMADLLSAEAMIALQDGVLGRLNERNVAIETLPTSNLRISVYDRMDEHHLFRWLGHAGPNLVNKPVVVVGSDDPGIFATSLRNEYAAIAAALRGRFGLSATDVSRTLAGLNDAGRIRRFRPGAGDRSRAGYLTHPNLARERADDAEDTR